MQDIIPEGYTRVSEILSIFQNYSSVPRAKLKAAQDIGTEVHAAIEAYFTKDWKVLDRKQSLYFDSFLHWTQEKDLKPLLIEERLFDHFYKITGRIDLLLADGDKTVLIDFKTGSWAHPEIWRLQGAFYRHLIGNRFKPDKYLFIQLLKDGTPPIIHEMDYQPSDWNICKYAMECYRYFNKTLDYISPMQV